MQITRGRIKTAIKCVLYGPEGIGKSTFASQFPDPLFSDTEGSTGQMDVPRLPRPLSWTMLMDEARYVRDNPDVCKTYIIDTADWAEMLCISSVCARFKKSGIEDFGYGKGYVFVAEDFGKLLNTLTEITERGINVVLTAHAKMRKFEQPDEMAPYDRWELKLSKQVAPLVKEWSDMLLFANYKTHVVKTDDNKDKGKAQGGKRVMYTTHHPCWDAKNRCGLPDELPFEYAAIAECLSMGEQLIPASRYYSASSTLTPSTASVPTLPVANIPAPATEPDNAAVESAPEIEPAISSVQPEPEPPVTTAPPGDTLPLPLQLKQLMAANNVTEAEIQTVVGRKGYYPEDTPIANYDPGFVHGVLIGAWMQVFDEIQIDRDCPF